MELVGRERKIIERRRFRCDEEELMADYFASLGEYQLGCATVVNRLGLVFLDRMKEKNTFEEPVGANLCFASVGSALG